MRGWGSRTPCDGGQGIEPACGECGRGHSSLGKVSLHAESVGVATHPWEKRACMRRVWAWPLILGEGRQGSISRGVIPRCGFMPWERASSGFMCMASLAHGACLRVQHCGVNAAGDRPSVTENV
eukprot:116852-Chlamydomonas_euryale.AAC.1